MLSIRRFRDADASTIWALNNLPNIGATANPTVPLPLPPATQPPPGFPDLADITDSFLAAGGEFLVAELDGHLVGMAGLRPAHNGAANILRVRVHPATRRRGIGRALMDALEQHARHNGLQRMFLDTATNQPEAMAFYENLGYQAVGREHQLSWTWTLVLYEKHLP
ncbi:GNAT family N-acetyltransferase [Cryptosporangium phraense]|uniref:GNAT family N-acetyltransferase n=1 Tax=Cryptosporangium phraense TaxID=2593070 RepID=A0A545AX49_9ACTN|nr:GNAT family N-acetyltransferase [Cryptosporangium phraense]TQS45906.1 GNAT family N-acetyltransferase [Cryptosporangium phraense]